MGETPEKVIGVKLAGATYTVHVEYGWYARLPFLFFKIVQKQRRNNDIVSSRITIFKLGAWKNVQVKGTV